MGFGAALPLVNGIGTLAQGAAAGVAAVGTGVVTAGTAIGAAAFAAGQGVYDEVVNKDGVIYGKNGEIVDYTRSARIGAFLQGTELPSLGQDTFAMSGATPPAATPSPTASSAPSPAASPAPAAATPAPSASTSSGLKQVCAGYGGLATLPGLAGVLTSKENEKGEEEWSHNAGLGLFGSGAAAAAACARKDTALPAGIGFGVGATGTGIGVVINNSTKGLRDENKILKERLDKLENGQKPTASPQASPTSGQTPQPTQEQTPAPPASPEPSPAAPVEEPAQSPNPIQTPGD